MTGQSPSGNSENWALPAGTKLDNGNIVIQGVLGGGGFGVTYQAQDAMFGEIALKEFLPKSMIMRREGGGDNHDVIVKQDKEEIFKRSKRQFWREPRIINTLNHPHIVKVLFDFQENNTAYYGMRLLKGMELADWLQLRGKPLDFQTASKLLFPIMDALIYIHRHGILHRDISPSNIFLEQTDDGWSPCLIDFGAAYTAQKDFTHTFNRVYNKNFSPPEQNWDGERQGRFSDVYAFCATFYYAMTGIAPIPPIERGTDEDDHLKPLIDAIPEGMPPISRQLSDVVMNGMKLNPEKRTQDMEQLKQAFDSVPGWEHKGEVIIVPPIDGGGGEVKTDEVPKKASARPLIALLVDWALLYLVYVAAQAGGLSLTVSLGASALAFLLVNGLLAGSGATIGQRIAGCSIPIKSKGCGFAYALVRLLPPLALIDECAACGARGRRIITRGLLKADDDRGEGAMGAPPTVERTTENRGDRRARLVCVAGEYSGEVFELDAPQMFGRDVPSTVLFRDGHVSSHHCMVRRMSGKTWHLIDMNSKNGTYLNNVKLASGAVSQALKPGDRFSLCSEIFVYEEY